MRKVGLKKIKQIRKKHNVDLIKRMHEGESLRSFDSQSSWFPERPVIKKDLKAIAKLYKIEDKEVELKADDTSHKQDSDLDNVQQLPQSS
ncbi:MAG: hypothetical protein AB8G05_18745 [Oligoflexales bacterium]